MSLDTVGHASDVASRYRIAAGAVYGRAARTHALLGTDAAERALPIPLVFVVL